MLLKTLRGMRSRNRPKVLLVEHDRDACLDIASVLRNDGFEVEIETGGFFVVDRICESVMDPLQRPDLVITDIRMPLSHGLDILAIIRCIDSRLPVIMVDEPKPNRDALTEAQRMGASAFLHKPVDSLQLREAVVRALS